MKQRLLLALLMLLTSAGFMKAEITITVPKGATPTISLSGFETGVYPELYLNSATVHTFTDGAPSYTVKADNENSQSYRISGNPYR